MNIARMPIFRYSKLELKCGPLAQLVEQLPLKEMVTGSSPVRPTRKIKNPTRGFYFG